MMTKKRVDDAIELMQREISSKPGEPTETPDGLKIELLGHQEKGLAWMLWREQQQTRGGILADDMGLGKTVSMISLILEAKNRRMDDIKTQKQSRPTLVIVPCAVLYQWKNEVLNRVEPNKLSVYVLHGNKKKRETNATTLASHDIVITTYGTVLDELKSSKNSSSVLTQITWERIILDEAHHIKNPKTNTSKAVCNLRATNRWCLTGTPIHNTLWDLFSLIRFIRLSPFNGEETWNNHVMNTPDKSDLNTLVKACLLRRTKEQIDPVTNKPIVDLKPKHFTLHYLSLKELEKKIYDMMFNSYTKKGKTVRYFNGKPKEMKKECILVTLLRLRQACVHLALTGNEFMENTVDELAMNLGRINLDENAHNEPVVASLTENFNEMLSNAFLSTKLQWLLPAIENVLHNGDKCIVVSQWPSFFDIVKFHLNAKNIEYAIIDGKTETEERTERATSFNDPDSSLKVMLLSLKAGGVGLNLIGGNHLFLVDPHWNPALEKQACDRIYRIGQQKEVYIHKLIVKDTIEQRVLDLQEKKLQLANSVLEVATADGIAEDLTIKEFLDLYQLEEEPSADASAPTNTDGESSSGSDSVSASSPTL